MKELTQTYILRQGGHTKPIKETPHSILGFSWGVQCFSSIMRHWSYFPGRDRPTSAALLRIIAGACRATSCAFTVSADPVCRISATTPDNGGGKGTSRSRPVSNSVLYTPRVQTDLRWSCSILYDKLIMSSLACCALEGYIETRTSYCSPGQDGRR